jgi:hypothetical protein
MGKGGTWLVVKERKKDKCLSDLDGEKRGIVYGRLLLLVLDLRACLGTLGLSD